MTDIQRRLQRLTRLARFLDTAFKIPGTRFRVGFDGLIGMIPGAGDLVTAGLAAYIVIEAWRMGVSKPILAKMIGNVLLDTVLGAIPIVGDAFDFIWKANARNVDLLNQSIDIESEVIPLEDEASNRDRKTAAG